MAVIFAVASKKVKRKKSRSNETLTTSETKATKKLVQKPKQGEPCVKVFKNNEPGRDGNA
jgi:hypothetical protein